MRILYFHQHFSTRKGTAGTRSYELARRLVERGHEVTLVCGANRRANSLRDNTQNGAVSEMDIDGISVIEISLPYSNYDSLLRRTITFIRFAFAGVRLALTRNFDLIFATSTPLTAGIPGIIASVFRKKPFVFEVRDLWPELPRAMGVISNPVVLAMMDGLELVSYRTSRACVALAPGIAEGIRKRSRKGHPIAVIPNACDLDLFSRAPNRANVWPEIRETDLICVFAGAHGLANGLDSAIDAAAALLERGEEDIKLVFIGDGREKPRLVRRVEDEGLTNCVFKGLIPKENLADVLAASDVGMQLLANIPAFYHGTSPNKFFDYIASGLPVLINYPGWLAELVNEQGCGTTVLPGDPDDFADALIKFRDNPAGREKMGEISRRLAERSFSRDELGQKFCVFLEQHSGIAPIK